MGALFAAAGIAANDGLPDSVGKNEVMAACTQCHGIDVVIAQKRTPDEWSEVLGRMVGNGAVLTDDQYQKVMKYLSANFGRSSDPQDAG